MARRRRDQQRPGVPASRCGGRAGEARSPYAASLVIKSQIAEPNIRDTGCRVVPSNNVLRSFDAQLANHQGCFLGHSVGDVRPPF
jgi:hypothetical protein